MEVASAADSGELVVRRDPRPKQEEMEGGSAAVPRRLCFPEDMAAAVGDGKKSTMLQSTEKR